MDETTLIIAYVPRIVLLLAGIGMAIYARRVLRGTAFAWVTLLSFLIVRSLDDAFHILSTEATIILSYAVAFAVIDALWGMVKEKKPFDLNRKRLLQKEHKLERDRREAERRSGSWDSYPNTSIETPDMPVYQIDPKGR